MTRWEDDGGRHDPAHGDVPGRDVGATLLAFAYACEPDEGSEPGVGWMWARMLARHGQTWVITRSNNRRRIEPALREIPERAKLHFVYVDLPAWSRFWKRGTRGLRLYYLLWQVAALRTARRLHHSIGFDVVWHLTLANAWLGSTSPLVGGSLVLGPVGGGVRTPWALVWGTGFRSSVVEVLRALGRGVGRYANPLARVAWAKADVILVQNRDTERWLPSRHRVKARVFPNVVFSSPSEGRRPGGERPRTALFVGRLIPWKGADLAIEAVAKASGWRLVVYGEGPDDRRLHRIALRANVSDRVEFRGRVTRAEVLRSMRAEAGVFLFPSLHDEAGWVVAEALAAELPIVCLANGGPALLADGYAIAVPTRGGRGEVTTRLADGLEQGRAASMVGASDHANQYWIERRAQALTTLVGPLLGQSRGSSSTEAERSEQGRPRIVEADQWESGG